MWLMEICHTFLHNFGDLSIKTVMYANNISMILFNMTIFSLYHYSVEVAKLCG